MGHIMLVTGGTGGHVFPALSLRSGLLEQNETVHIIVDQRGNRFIPTDIENVTKIDIHRRLAPFGQFYYPLSLFLAFIRCLVTFIINRPKTVVGFGGYTTMPALMAAYILGIPIVIHEANSFLGKANRFLQHITTKIAVSFPHTLTKYPKKTFVTGMPLRADFNQSYEYKAPQEAEDFHLLIIGGSQGSNIFSSLIPSAINLLPIELQKRLVIHHQVRQETLDLARLEYMTLPCTVTLQHFFDDMPRQYSFAHLVIARAGASSIFELAYAKRPVILFPFAASLEGDQAKNAQALEDINACWVLNEKGAGATTLATLLETIMCDSHLLEKKSKAIATLVDTNPTYKFVEILKNITKK